MGGTSKIADYAATSYGALEMPKQQNNPPAKKGSSEKKGSESQDATRIIPPNRKSGAVETSVCGGPFLKFRIRTCLLLYI